MDNQSVTNDFGYNVRSEVISAMMNSNQFGYAYDPIGNRLAATNNAEALSYVANELNQYTNITDGVTLEPVYDDDGNMIAYGDWAFTWNGENRLVAAQQGKQCQVTFAYDYMGRRVSKVTEDGSGTTECDYVYDGWALIRERIASGETAQTNSYVYGLDLSGGLQGAGTIGGLLVADFNGTNAFYCYDANGNVTDLVGTNGTGLAHYEYDPFGNPLVATGTLAATNPFRFSTKYTDDETGLVYYGYRYYSPEMGRWLSRDPIGENGGIIIYGFIYNAPANAVDPLGESLYAIDGTWYDIDNKTHGYSNVKAFQTQSNEQPSRYYGGPGTYGGSWSHFWGGAIGAGSKSIARDVYIDACVDYCSGNCEINLVGWSRGAVIAVEIADMLHKEGCYCKRGYPVPVNFLGLYDAVKMIPHGSWAQRIPNNVKNYAHAIKTKAHPIYITKRYGGNEMPFDLRVPRCRDVVMAGPGGTVRVCDGQSTHADIGAAQNTGAHDWIISQAKSAGVDF